MNRRSLRHGWSWRDYSTVLVTVVEPFRHCKTLVWISRGVCPAVYILDTTRKYKTRCIDNPRNHRPYDITVPDCTVMSISIHTQHTQVRSGQVTTTSKTQTQNQNEYCIQRRSPARAKPNENITNCPVPLLIPPPFLLTMMRFVLIHGSTNTALIEPSEDHSTHQQHTQVKTNQARCKWYVAHTHAQYLSPVPGVCLFTMTG